MPEAQMRYRMQVAVTSWSAKLEIIPFAAVVERKLDAITSAVDRVERKWQEAK